MEDVGVGSLFKRCTDCGHIGGHHPWCGIKWKEERGMQGYLNTPRVLDGAKEVWQKPSFSAGYDAVNPPHYSRRAIEPWDYVAANKLGYFEGNAIKYITRWRDKNGITDLRKAIRFLEKLIETEEAEKAAAPEWDARGTFVYTPQNQPWQELVRDAGQDVGGQPRPGNPDQGADTGNRT